MKYAIVPAVVLAGAVGAATPTLNIGTSSALGSGTLTLTAGTLQASVAVNLSNPVNLIGAVGNVGAANAGVRTLISATGSTWWAYSTFPSTPRSAAF